jgi:hypothetical protein
MWVLIIVYILFCILFVLYKLACTFPLKVKLTTRWKRKDFNDRRDLPRIQEFTGDEAEWMLEAPENVPSFTFKSGIVELSCYNSQLKKRFHFESFSLDETLEAYKTVKKNRFLLAPMPWQMIGWLLEKSR